LEDIRQELHKNAEGDQSFQDEMGNLS